MNEEIEQSQQDANTADTSDAASTSDQATTSGEAVETKQQSAEDNVPFHEHPRFKELVSQKNEAMEQAKTLSERYAQMEEQIRKLQAPQAKKEENPLYSRLKGIDPEFGGEFEKVASSLKELEELKQWKSNFEQEQVRTRTVATVNQLHETNKVPSELRELYNQQLEGAYARDPKTFMKDVSASYKSVHDRMSKILDSVKRSERESYVTGKKADAATPGVSKGKSVNASKEFKYSDDPGEARSQLVKRAIELAKAERE